MPEKPTPTQLNRRLERAERENHIQAALDRVRNKALAMASTDDIGEVVVVTRDALIELGIEPFRTAIGIEDEAANTLHAWTAKESDRFWSGDRHLDESRKIDPALVRGRRKWTVQRYTRTQLRKLFRAGTTAVMHGRERADRIVEASPNPMYRHLFWFSGGGISLDMDRELEKEEIAIARRVTDTFDVAYKRFAELQEKERQNHELRVEAALEKVRSRALAMQTTQDIGSVVELTREALQDVGVEPHRAIIMIERSDSDTSEMYWVRSRASEYMAHPRAVLYSHLPSRKVLGSLQVRKPHHTINYTTRREVRQEFQGWVRVAEKANQWPDGIDKKEWLKARIDDTPLPYFQYHFFFANGDISVGLGRELSGEEMETCRRITETFDFAYKRFLDLQQKEQRAREAEVEASLERVRAAALSMQTSEDLTGVAGVLFEELIRITPETQRSAISTGRGENWIGRRSLTDEGKIDSFYEVFDENRAGKATAEEFRGLKAPVWFKDVQAKKEQGDRSTVVMHDRKAARAREELRLKVYEKQWSKLTPAQRRRYLDRFDNGQWHYFFFMEQGWLSAILPCELTEADVRVGERFAEVFSMAYNRFLELQAKEQRAREAEVEAALERIRAQALAMQTPSELRNVTDALYDEIQSLGFGLHWLSVQTRTPAGVRMTLSAGDRDQVEWQVASGNQRPARSAIWRRFQREVQEIRDRGEAFHAIHVKGKEVRELVKALITAQGRSKEEIAARLEDLPPTLTSHRVFHEHGLVAFVRETPLDADEAAIAKRFTDAFDFAYKRFLDLQEKERRAREAEVEAALERVRGAALSMQTSDDLPTASAAMFRELKALYPDTYSSVIGSIDEAKENQIQWVVVAEDLPSESFVDVREVDGLRVAREHWKTSVLREGAPILREWFDKIPSETPTIRSGLVTTEEHFRMIDHWVKRGQWTAKQAREHRKWWPGDCYNVSAHHGYAYLFSFHAKPLTDSETEEYKRFVEVWSFAHSRFLDLQAKEQRAREAEIEAALERVRAQALSMQTSEDLPSVSAAVFREFRALYPKALNSVIGIVDEEADRTTQWVVVPEYAHEAYAENKTFVYDDVHVALEELQLSAMRRVERQFNPAFNACSAKVGTRHVPVSWTHAATQRAADRLEKFGLWTPRQARLMKEAWKKEPRGPHIDLVQNKHGYLFVVLRSPMSESEVGEVSRFSEAFAFAYDRFLDLQDKERRAREAEIEAALERVRARALGMQESGEIHGVAIAMRNEFEDLGHAVDRVMIILPQEDTGTVDYWGVGPLQGRDETFEVGESGKLDRRRRGVRRWKRGERYWYEEQDRKELIQRMRRNMRRAGQSTDEIRTRIAALPDRIFQNCVNFEDGSIVFRTGEPFDSAELEVAGRFTDVFGIAYRRFKELQLKEEQNRELAVEAALERVRGLALAMESREDLTDISQAIYEELHSLSIQLTRSGITMWSLERGGQNWTTQPVEDRVESRHIVTPPDSWADETKTRERSRDARHSYHHFKLTRQEARERARSIRKWLGRDDVLEMPTGPEYHYNLFISSGHVTLVSGTALDDSQVEIGIRFAKLFEFAYDRFLELDAKQRANRELAVEAALERVRGLALAMEGEDDLEEISTAIYLELVGLGFDLGRSTISIYEGEEHRGWMTARDDATSPPPADARGAAYGHGCFTIRESDIPEAALPFYAVERKANREARKGGAPYAHLARTKEEAKARSNALGSPRWSGRSENQYNLFFESSQKGDTLKPSGWVTIVLPDPLAEADIEIAIRFTRLFEFAYERFLELDAKQKANRELAVEAALERVRSQALAMEGHDDLLQVTSSIADEIKALGIDLDRLTITLPEEGGGHANWRAWGDRYGKVEASFGLLRGAEKVAGSDPEAQAVVAAAAAGEAVHHFEIDKAEILARLERWAPFQVDSDLLDPKIRAAQALDREQHYTFLFKRSGWVRLVTENPITDEDVQTVRRFSSLFEFAYDRFLELDAKQKANRALLVEGALERVRSRSLAMEGTDELGSVAETLLAEMRDLGFDLHALGITLEEDGTAHSWSTTGDGKIQSFVWTPSAQFLEVIGSEILEAAHSGQKALRCAWDEARATRFTRYVVENEQELRDCGVTSQVLQRWRRIGPSVQESGTYYQDYLYFPHGWIVAWSKDGLSDEDVRIGSRFAEEFGFAYDRYCELAEKIRQNRALLVEGALERVRSRSLAMEGTDELGEVSKAVYAELADLGMDLLRTSITVVDEGHKSAQNWTTDGGEGSGPEVVEYPTELGRSVAHLERWLNRSSEDRHGYLHVGRDELAKRKKDRRDEWKKTGYKPLDIQKRWFLQDRENEHLYQLYFDHGWLMLVSEAPIPDSDIEIGLRFAAEFGFAYDRHLELAEKIRQNRALLVEGALERVRSRSLAMEGTDELSEVASTLFRELTELGLDQRRLSITICDQPAMQMQSWQANADGEGGQEEIVQFVRPLAEEELRDDGQFKAWRSGESSLHMAWDHAKAQEVREWADRHAERWLAGGMPKRVIDNWRNAADHVPFHSYNLFHRHGWLFVTTYEPLSDDEIQIGLRFAEEFGFAYARHVELAEKIRQNRALLVEGALERVRSRSLAMEGTDELPEVAKTLFEEFGGLGFEPVYLSVLLTDFHSDYRSFGSSSIGGTFVGGNIDPAFWAHPVMAQLCEANKAGETHFHKRFERDEMLEAIAKLSKWLPHLETNYRELGPVIPDVVDVYSLFYKGGYLLVYLAEPFSNEDLEIGCRFAAEFGFAYARYQDLAEKIRQNRELQVEASLERVRARAQGMQESADIRSVVEALAEEMMALGFGVSRTGITVVDLETNISTNWRTHRPYFVDRDGRSQLSEQTESNFLSTGSPVVNWTGHFGRAWKAGERHLLIKRTPEQVYEREHRREEFAKLARGDWEAYLDLFRDGQYHHFFYFRHGWVSCVLTHDLSEADVLVGQRFSEVFGFAYDRFKELKLKEEQNRELTIQNALERVRARALGMQESAELSEVAAVLRTELAGLDLRVMGTGISLFHDDDRLEIWIEPITGLDVRVFKIDVNDLCQQLPWAASWTSPESGANSRFAFTENQWEAWNRYCLTLHDSKYANKDTEVSRREAVVHSFGFTDGTLDLVLPTDHLELSDGDIDVAQRFADAFGLAFDRFRELKEKEDQNRELTIQNALERVRAKAQGMQESGEIKGVATALRDEFEDLGYAINSASIGIVQEELSQVEHWIANVWTERGTTFGEPYRLPIDRHSLPYRSWKSGEQNWVIEWDRKQLVDNLRRVNEGFGVPETKIEARLKSLPDTPYSNFIHFGPGWISFITSEAWEDDTLAVAKRFAEVFSGAFARFIELKEKEAQNRELTIQNALERVRSRALGMQESRELSDVTQVMREELKEVGVPFAQIGLALQPDDEHVEIWFPPGLGLESRSLRDSREALIDRFPWLAQVMGERGSSMSFEMTREELRSWTDYYYDTLEHVGAEIERPPNEVFDRLRFGVKSYAFERGAMMLSQVETDGEMPEGWERQRFQEVVEDRFDDAEAVAARFAEVFGFAYSRHRELEQKEEQNRELTIQNALERVRAKAQGMQVSDEIAGVAKAIYEECQGLGFGLYRTTVSIRESEDSNIVQSWAFHETRQELWDISDEEMDFRKPNEFLVSDELVRLRKAAIDRGDWYYSNRIEGKALRAFRRENGKRNGFKGEALKAFVNREPQVEERYFVFHAHGSINFIKTEPMPEADLLVAKRFTDVFDYAYDRFQELKEKEAQNRELTIQNALERVRARALGMQESEELSEVVMLLRGELGDLSFQFHSLSINIEVGENEVDVWVPALKGQEFRVLRAEYDKLPWGKSVQESLQSGGHFVSHLVTGADIDTFAEYWRELNARAGHPLKKPLPTNAWVGFYAKFDAMSDAGSIGLTMSPEEYADLTPEEKDVIGRFADTFGFAYSRFLELKEKEDQNRELTIQNALERVRARAQGMQESAEIAGVTSILFEEFKSLGYELTHSAISLIDEENEVVDYWATSSRTWGLKQSQSPNRIPIEMLGDGTLDARARGEAYHTVEFPTRREVEAFYISMTLATTGRTRASAKKWVGENVPRRDYVAVHQVFHTHGLITFGTEHHWTDDDLAIAKRFTDVFDYAYDRFQELKEKEDQNRELTIQNALERVRAKAQGMQVSDEIADVTTLLYDEFVALGHELTGLSVMLIDQQNETADSWAIGFEKQETSWTGTERLSRSPIRYATWQGRRPMGADETREARKRGEPHCILELGTEDEQTRFRRESMAMAGRSPQEIEAHFKEWSFPGYRACHRVFHSYGWIAFWLGRKLTDDELAVAKRFTDVFDYAYGRFRELEEKEAQNRELTIQNAIERVRARALGMQESDEIKDVAKQIFEEIEQFGLRPFNANIGVHDHESNILTNYFSHADDGPLGNRSLSLAASQTPYTIVDNPNPDVDYHVIEMSGAELKQGVKTYLELLWNPGTTQISLPLGPARTAYLENHPDSLVFHYAYFDGGFLLVTNREAFLQDDIDLLCRLSRTFEFAYSRFLELKQKEDQNRELTIQNALERVRSQAQGMQESEELAQVVECIYDEFSGLGYPLNWTQIAAYDPDEAHVDIWHSSDTIRLAEKDRWTTEQARLARMRSRRTGRHLAPGLDEARERGDRYFIEEMDWAGESGDRRIAWMKGAGFDFEPSEIEALRARPPAWEHSVFHTHGVVKFSLAKQLAEDDLAVAVRFGEAFDFAYSRFRELQEKEEQAREADVRAAVDRVRAEATAMEKADDIADVVTALWDGLIRRDVAFAFLTMEVIDTDANVLQAYAAMPDRNPIQDRLEEDNQSLNRGLVIRENILEGVDLLRSEISLTEAIDAGFSIDALKRTVIDEGSDRSAFIEKVWGIKTSGDQPAVVKALRAGFEHGSLNLYVDPDAEIPPETISFVEALGEAVSLGFARYWDFRELEDQNRALEEANEEVRAATAMKSQFLATMSHELRTPMNAIIGFTKLVMRRGSDNLTDRQKGNLEKVQLSADHLLNLINEILDLSKVEAGRVDIEADTFELEPLLQGACNTVGPTLGKAGVQVNCEVASDVGEIYSDEARLRQVVINLLSNALKFTDSGSVSLSAQRSAQSAGGDSITIAVADTGIGIPQDQLETIFEEFRQVDGSSTRRHQGTGLGLAITKKLVELLGGQISVESTVGEGSTFTIELPVKYGDSQVAPLSRPTPQAPDPSEQASGRAGEREKDQNRIIVSIDDDPNVAVLLRQELEDDGYTVVSALNADEGVALVKKHQPAAVTVDILMPGKDGWETIGMLKGDPETREVPIIVVSGLDNRDLGSAMGVKDYLVKPVDREALLKALEKIEGDVKHVLVVDDEASARDLLVQILDDEGLESRTAVNGREALEQIEKGLPDAILLDLMMPEVDGFEVVQRLQEKEAWKGIPVIVVTAKDLELEEKTFLSERVERVVQKGRLEPSELGKAIKEIVSAAVTPS